MKKLLLTLLLSTFLLSGCAVGDSDSSLPTRTNQSGESALNLEQGVPDKSEEGQAGEYFSEDMATGNLSGETAFQPSLFDKIATEISYAEGQEKEVEKKQKEAVTQLEMSEAAEEMYQLWDDTLNAVWKLLEANLSESDMEVLRKEENEWITFKEAEVQATGLEYEGGSAQLLDETMKAAELTKERVYELAQYTERK